MVRTVNMSTDRVYYSRKIAVGNVEGFELASDMGSSHFAWIGRNLVTDEMAGSRMSNPLPILTPISNNFLAWNGLINTGEKWEPASAKIQTVKAKLDLHGASTDTVRSTVVITLPGREIDLKSWFKAGVGLVRQEQTTNGRLDLMLEFLD
jgi:hypothetical protein